MPEKDCVASQAAETLLPSDVGHQHRWCAIPSIDVKRAKPEFDDVTGVTAHA